MQFLEPASVPSEVQFPSRSGHPGKDHFGMRRRLTPRIPVISGRLPKKPAAVPVATEDATEPDAES